ncbi:hypothetical protein ACFU0X_10345 [Streptomyces cellulosae]|uniref:Uncharacterized protein n=1 Tax=Streptomyces cellulosae TaxID=1968 RepID=A0ABW6JFF2_STRCE
MSSLDSDIALFTALRRRGGWLQGLLVARRVQPKTAASTGEAAKTYVRVSPDEFAQRTGTYRDDVLALWDAWERAADDGVVPHALELTPATDVGLPNEDEIPWTGRRGYCRMAADDALYQADAHAAEAAANDEADEEHLSAQAYIRAAQERMGGNPVADLDRAEAERDLTDRLLVLKLELDAVLRTMQGRKEPLSDHSRHLLQVTCEHITAASGWISTLAGPGQHIDDQALEAFLASEGGK